MELSSVAATTATASTVSNAAVTSAVLKELAALSRQSPEPCPNADVLCATLATVSQCYTVPVPSHSAGAIDAALHQVRHALQQHRLFAEIDASVAYTPTQREPLERGLRLLWSHATTYKLHSALIDIVRTIDSLPRAIAFWKKLRRHHVRAAIQKGPLEWLLPAYVRNGRVWMRTSINGWY